MVVNSKWRLVTNCVHQVLVLGPLLFVIHINYLDLDEALVSKFTDENKIDGKNGYQELQSDPDQLGKWASTEFSESDVTVRVVKAAFGTLAFIRPLMGIVSISCDVMLQL